MPIVGGTNQAVTTTITGNVSDWSHSTIFSTSADTYAAEDAPALTTYWTPPALCSGRWMGGDTFTAYQATTFTEVVPDLTLIITRSTAIDSTRLTSSPTLTAFLPVITPNTGRTTPYGIFVAFSTTPVDTRSGAVYDHSYTQCQPLGALLKYSPGICPQGQTVAEITEYHYAHTSGSIATRFSASCCQRDMTFGPQWDRACIGTISTPLEISVPFTTTLDNTLISSYEYVARIFVAATYGTDGYSTSTFSNISTATAGFIAADPIVVGFQEHDLSSFPAEYVSSLADRYDRTWTAASPTATAAGAPSLPAQTNSSSEPSSTSGLSTGAKVGIGIGTGVGTIVLAVLGAFVFWRKRTKATEHQEDNGISDIGIPEMEDREEVLSSKKWYLFGKWRNEMPTWSHRHELDPKGIHVVNQVPVELEALENPQELEPHGVDGVQAREDQD